MKRKTLIIFITCICKTYEKTTHAGHEGHSLNCTLANKTVKSFFNSTHANKIKMDLLANCDSEGKMKFTAFGIKFATFLYYSQD